MALVRKPTGIYWARGTDPNNVIVTNKELNIGHRFVSIGGCENHDKEQFNSTGTNVGLQIYWWVG